MTKAEHERADGSQEATGAHEAHGSDGSDRANEATGADGSDRAGPAHEAHRADAAGPQQTAAALDGRDFIRTIIAGDLRSDTHGGRVVTRFPPEPNGFLHIGHAKSINLNFGLANEIPGARCHLRFDDTNPETEDMAYVEAIKRDVEWLGFEWGEHLYFASDYFDEMYRIAEHLIEEGKAYVDSQDEEAIREGRGTVTEPGTPSPYRDRPTDESLDLFRRMKAGEFPNGAHVLRGKIDMASPNMLLRDPVLYRIRHASHYRTGDRWCIYPLYDYAHPIEDALEDITHSLCTLEFEINRPLYDWVVENSGLATRPRQYEFARGNLDFTVMSKRKLLTLVKAGHVSGWDDPRMPTIAGLRRRGVTPEAIRSFWDMLGVTKTDSRVDVGKLEYAIRDDLNDRAPRVLCVLRPLRVRVREDGGRWTADGIRRTVDGGRWTADGGRRTVDGGRDTEDGGRGTAGLGVPSELEASYWPHDVDRSGSRRVPFSTALLIEREDFSEDPPADWRRLAPGRAVRLRHGPVIRCDEVVRGEDGEVVELVCSWSPESLEGDAPGDWDVGGAIHWVDAERSLACEVRLYDRLFTVADPDAEAAATGREFTEFLNPDSLVVVEGARIEPSVQGDPAGSRYQFERQGYFISDEEDSSADRLVFNRTVTLRDTWARRARAGGAAGATGDAGAGARAEGGAGAGGRRRPAERSPDLSPEEHARLRAEAAPERSEALEARRRRYQEELGVDPEDAELITREAVTADFFEAAVETASAAGGSAQRVANWVVNELPREIGDRTLDNLPFGGAGFGALVALLEDGTLSSSTAREVLSEMVSTGASPGTIVDERGLRQISDEAALGGIVERVIAAHPAKAEEYRAGRPALLGFFMGQVMRETGGKANPELAKRLIREHLD